MRYRPLLFSLRLACWFFVTIVMFGARASCQTVDVYLSQGRANLSASNLHGATLSFSNAVRLSPNHQTGNVYYALTRLLSYPTRQDVSNFLSTIGFSASGRDIYNWTALPPRDSSQNIVLPQGVNASAVAKFWRTNVLTEIRNASLNLGVVQNTNFVITLSANETRISGVTLDYGDIAMLKSMLKGLELWILYSHSLNLSSSLGDVGRLFSDESVSIESFLATHPDFLTYSSPQDLLAGRTALNDAVVLYNEASEFIRNRSPEKVRLFNLLSEESNRERKLRFLLNELRASLDGPVRLTGDQRFTIFTASLFDGTHPLRPFLPSFSEQYLVIGTLPDRSFGGIAAGLKRGEVENYVGKFVPTIPRISEEVIVSSGTNLLCHLETIQGRGYILQSSTNLLNWSHETVFMGLGSPITFMYTNREPGIARFFRIGDVGLDIPPPANDAFSNRIHLSGNNFSVLGYTTKATLDPGEDLPYGDAEGASVWWSWTASTSDETVIGMVDRYRYGKLYIYTGNSLENLAWHSFGNSPFQPVPGTTYLIQARESYDGKTGGFRLVVTRPPVATLDIPISSGLSEPTNILINASGFDPDGHVAELELSAGNKVLFQTTNTSFNYVWTNAESGYHWVELRATDNLGVSTTSAQSLIVRPKNDSFQNAIVLTNIDYAVKGSNEGATKEPSELNHSGIPSQASVWYAWRSDFDGYITIAAESESKPYDSSLRLVLGVYNGFSGGEVARGAGCCGMPALATLAVSNGVWYYLAVDDESGGRKFRLSFTRSRRPLCQITSPAFGMSFTNSSVVLEATATDADGLVNRVDFYNAKSSSLKWLGMASNAPYSITLSNLTLGDYKVVARAVDNQGAIGFSVPVEFSITKPRSARDGFGHRRMIVTVTDGSAPFADKGSYTLTTDGNPDSTSGSYYVTGDGVNVRNSVGNYWYILTGDDTATIFFTDSFLGDVTCELYFPNAQTHDGYLVSSDSSGGFQTGVFNIILAP